MGKGATLKDVADSFFLIATGAAPLLVEGIGWNGSRRKIGGSELDSLNKVFSGQAFGFGVDPSSAAWVIGGEFETGGQVAFDYFLPPLFVWSGRLSVARQMLHQPIDVL